MQLLYIMEIFSATLSATSLVWLFYSVSTQNSAFNRECLISSIHLIQNASSHRQHQVQLPLFCLAFILFFFSYAPFFNLISCGMFPFPFYLSLTCSSLTLISQQLVLFEPCTAGEYFLRMVLWEAISAGGCWGTCGKNNMNNKCFLSWWQ